MLACALRPFALKRCACNTAPSTARVALGLTTDLSSIYMMHQDDTTSVAPAPNGASMHIPTDTPRVHG